MNTSNNYYVKDLYEAGFLYASNIPLVGLEKNGASFYFVFTPRTECELLRDKFWSMSPDIHVNPKKYANAIRSLKERIFSNP